MKDTLFLDSAPAMADCAQLGETGYYRKAELECKLYIECLKEEYGEPPAGTRFRVKRNPHDFGTYLSVEVEFDPDSDISADYAYMVDEGLEDWPRKVREIKATGGYNWLEKALALYLDKKNGKKYGLEDLLKITGLTYDALMSDCLSDGVCEAICTECGYTTQMEPDQDRGYCELCGKNTVQSAMVLGGII